LIHKGYYYSILPPAVYYIIELYCIFNVVMGLGDNNTKLISNPSCFHYITFKYLFIFNDKKYYLIIKSTINYIIFLVIKYRIQRKYYNSLTYFKNSNMYIILLSD